MEQSSRPVVRRALHQLPNDWLAPLAIGIADAVPEALLVQAIADEPSSEALAPPPNIDLPWHRVKDRALSKFVCPQQGGDRSVHGLCLAADA